MRKHRPAFIVRILLLVAAWTGSPFAAASPGTGITFIVNARNPTTSISEKDLVAYYQKKIREWPDGTPIRFVDRDPGSPERELFLQNVLQRSEREIDYYWIAEKVRSGASAPIQVSNDTLVVEMVSSFAGAIGYVSSRTNLAGAGVKPISVSGLRPETK